MNPLAIIAANPRAKISSSKIIINTRLRYARNIAGYPFPGAIKPAAAVDLWEKISSFLSGTEQFRGGHRVFIPELKKSERIFLVERRLLSPDLIKAGVPAGVIFSRDERFVTLVNEEDHLRFSVTEAGPVCVESAAALADMEKAIGEKFPYARMKKYGYLTSCPSNLGTGYRISALFHLGGSVLDKSIEGLLDNIEKEGYYVRGYYGEKSRYFGDVFQISTGVPPRPTELRDVYDFFSTVEKKEQRVRESLMGSGRRTKTEDIVFRAWGIFTSARLMSFDEAVSVISIIILGKGLGFDLDVAEETLHRLLVDCQPAHLQVLAGREMTAAERDEFRADYIRRAAKQ